MHTRRLLWALPALAYTVFALWYTNLSGPLEEDEINAFITQLQGDGLAQEQIARLRRFMQEDTGRHFLMVNLLDLREVPDTLPGLAPIESSEAAMGHYMAYMFPELSRRASHPVLMGPAVFDAMDLAGIEGAAHWEQAALMRYRSRRDFLEIVANPEMRLRHPYKVAAMEKTIAFPIEPALHYADPRLLLALALLAVVGLVDLALYRRGRGASAAPTSRD